MKWAPRAWAAGCLAAIILGVAGARITVSWLNSIPNSPASHGQWGATLRLAAALLLLMLLAIASIGLLPVFRPLRLSSAVTLIVIALLAGGFILGSVVGLLAIPLVSGYFFAVAAAFFAVGALRNAWLAWRGDHRWQPAAAASVLSALGFVISVHLMLLLDKSLSLGWASAMD